MKGTSTERWADLMLKAVEALGKDWTRVSKYKQFFQEAGFEDIVVHKYEWPVGTWARGERMKLLGLWYREDLLSGLQGISLAVLTRGLGMSKEEVDLLLLDVTKELRSNAIHIFVPV